MCTHEMTPQERIVLLSAMRGFHPITDEEKVAYDRMMVILRTRGGILVSIINKSCGDAVRKEMEKEK